MRVACECGIGVGVEGQQAPPWMQLGHDDPLFQDPQNVHGVISGVTVTISGDQDGHLAQKRLVVDLPWRRG
jgi:hypothetical protein